MRITLLWLLLLSTAALAQAPADLKPLAARTFTRSFNGSNLSMEYTLRAGPEMEPGKRRFIEIDIDTLMNSEAAQRGEFSVPLNGFISIALPPGIEPDGELRMKFYNDSTGRYDFMYSAPYPADVIAGSEQSAQDAASKDVTRILAGMRGLSQTLDPNVSFTGPRDSRLQGSDTAYAVVGSSWLIPCNTMFQQLVNPFEPGKSIDMNPRLQAVLPVRIAELVTDPRIIVYIGSLSSAVSETTVMSDAIPANVRLLEEPPLPAGNAGAAETPAPAGTEAAPAEGNPPTEILPEPVSVPLRALQYSYGWAAWETTIDLAPVIVASALSPDYVPDAAFEDEAPVNLDEQVVAESGPISISAADPTERLSEQPAEPATAGVDSSSSDGAAEISPEETESAAADVADASAEDGVAPASHVEEQPAEDAAAAAAGSAASAEDEAVPGSLAELKQAVEERKERESGNSVNIELPPSARETKPAAEPQALGSAEQTEQAAAEPVEQAAAEPVEQGTPELSASEDSDNTLPQAEAVVDSSMEEVPEPATQQTDSGDSSAEEELPVDSSDARAPETADQVPAFAFPEEIAVSEEEEAGSPQAAEQAAAEQAAPADGADFREIEPGSLPGEEDMFSVPIKLITGRDGRKPQTGSGGGTAPDYTQLYIGGTPSQLPDAPAAGDIGEMVFVPGGKFMMGTDDKASAGDEDERPRHEVEVADFYIDKYPVTNRQYYQFVLSDGYKPQGNWQKYFEPGTADMPVRGVSWEDASAYCRWAGKRLPTEAEWEKAARGTDERLYPWGNDWSSDILPRGALNYRLVLNQKVASPYGALAMVGVLWQWTASAWAPYPYDPNAQGTLKVLRGGAFSNGRNIIRCANRYPEEQTVGFNTFTFRCAKDAN